MPTVDCPVCGLPCSGRACLHCQRHGQRYMFEKLQGLQQGAAEAKARLKAAAEIRNAYVRSGLPRYNQRNGGLIFDILMAFESKSRNLWPEQNTKRDGPEAQRWQQYRRSRDSVSKTCPT